MIVSTQSSSERRSTTLVMIWAGWPRTLGKFYSGPAERNKQPILEILQQYLLPQQDDQHSSSLNSSGGSTILEICSGSGQHVQHFAREFPSLQFLPTEYPGYPSPGAKQPQDLEAILGSIVAYSKGIPNILPPVLLDVTSTEWPTGGKGNVVAIVCINLCHIAPMKVTEALFAGAEHTLPSGGLLFLYGPFKFGSGPAVPESNAQFDAKLHQIDPAFGIRNVLELDSLAASCGFSRIGTHEMPAHNHTLVYKKA